VRRVSVALLVAMLAVVLVASPASAATQRKPPSWGLRRISEHALDLTRPYVYGPRAGHAVDVWIVGTGIEAGLAEFGGRATAVYNSVPNETGDPNGHSTEAASIVGAATYGVAKRVSIDAVKVLDKDANGSISDAIAGIDFVVSHKQAGPAILLLDLGTIQDGVFASAVNAAIGAGLFVVVSAGNDARSSCPWSASPGVYVVGATNRSDAMATFSNTGCTSTYAPGVKVTAMSRTGGSLVVSGTSWAAAHVAGCAARYASTHDATPDQIGAALNKAATKGVVTGLPLQSPNRLLYCDPTW
jgi:hypothetical protein